MAFRKLSFIDQCLSEIDHFLHSVILPATSSARPSPAESFEEADLSEKEARHVRGLMRVDHTGEICAQALYRGQAFVAKDMKTKVHLYQAASEEYDHLAWCEARLNALSAKKSLLNPLWYLGSFTIGAAAGCISDKISYGFVMETEKQVMRHLESHLRELPIQDRKSRAVLAQMYEDEKSHATQAECAGGIKLPLALRGIMKLQSKVMTTLVYRV